MKKKIKSILLVAGLIMSTGVLATAAVGPSVYGHSRSTYYHGHVEGNVTGYGVDAETYAYRDSGSEGMYAYVECVNGQGYRIGNGRESWGSSYAYTGFITRESAVTAYGTIGTSTGTSSAYCHL